MNVETIIAKVKSIVTGPEVFFQNLKEERLQDVFVYYALLSLVGVVFGALFGLFAWLGASTLFPVHMMGFLTGPLILMWSIVGYAIGLATSFVWAGLLFVWLMLFGGEASYERTYQLYVYAQTPYLLLSWFPVVNFLAWVYTLIIYILGTPHTHKISKGKSIIAYLIPFVVFPLIMLLFAIIVVTLIAAR